jgi:UDP-2,3-diacylglucosamine hydrolase
MTRGMKPLMKRSAAGKVPEIIEVDQATVEAYMTRHGADELIHGHTHRPGIHHFDLNGKAARRIVLGDWYEQDSVLVCRDGERKLLRVREYLS